MPKTVLVTGSTGFIAKHICRKLLAEGYDVRGSVRSLKRGQEVADAVMPYMEDPDSLDKRLTFVELDLTRDEGWQAALEGVDVLMHTASPFPMSQPDDETTLVGPAVDGTLRALRAARNAGVERVILTSSVASVMETDLPAGKTVYDETVWSDTDSPSISPYSKSKTLAERAAWDFVDREAPRMKLTTINPGLVLGPALDEHFGTSMQLLQRIVRAKDPALPRIGFSIVDVRDIATMHVAAIDAPESIGNRHIGVSRFMWMPEIADVVADAYPDRKIVTRRAPNVLIRLLALFDRSVKGIVPMLDIRREATNEKAQRVFRMQFIDAADTIRESADFLIRRGLV